VREELRGWIFFVAGRERGSEISEVLRRVSEK
jgi:hypothetical protein